MLVESNALIIVYSEVLYFACFNLGVKSLALMAIICGDRRSGRSDSINYVLDFSRLQGLEYGHHDVYTKGLFLQVGIFLELLILLKLLVSNFALMHAVNNTFLKCLGRNLTGGSS